MKILKGDTVKIIAGKDKGKSGTVIATLPSQELVVVDGVNVVTKHMKNRRQRSQGQVIHKSMPLHVSNVGLVHKDKAVRIGYRFEGEGDSRKKVRIARPTGDKV